MHEPNLTHRELQVLALIHDGLTNLQIAQELGISKDTVKDHTRRIYPKLGVGNRAEAAACYERHYGSQGSST